MAVSDRGLKWLFRINKIYTLERDFVWHSGHSIGDDHLVFEDKKKKLRMIISTEGIITIKEHYTWDGCTPKISFFDLFIIGTPDGILHRETGKPKTYFASLVHDALYQFLPDMPDKNIITRRDADDLFRRLLIEYEFAPNWVYWAAVRLFGGILMQARRSITRNTRGTVRRLE